MKVTFKTGSEVNYGSTNGELFFASNTKQIMLNGIKYIPKKLSELINDSGFITSITKSMVENVLTGNITSHTHSYLPLSGGTLTGTLTLPGIKINGTSSVLPSHYFHNLYSGTDVYEHFGLDDRNIVTYGNFRFFDGEGSFKTLRIGGDGTFKWNGTPVSLSGHTHTFASLESKPTTLSGYGITDGMRFIQSDASNYVEARFIDTTLAKKAANAYIEFWQGAGGWFNLMAGKFITSGGTSSQFLKGDGSLDSNTYALSSALNNYLPLAGGTLTGNLTCNGTITAATFNGSLNGTATKAAEAGMVENSLSITLGTSAVQSYNGSAAVSLSINPSTIGAATASHTHSYLPLSGGTMSNTNVVTNLNADLLDGYHHSSFAKIASDNNLIAHSNEFTFVPSAYAGEVFINYRTTGGTNGAITKYNFYNGGCGVLASISQGQFSGNASSSSKWATARTITLTGSVTGSISIDGSQNVSLATTTNHTHSEYLPLTGGTLNGALTVPKLTSTGGILLGDSSLSAMVGSIGIQRYDETGFIGFLKDFNLDNSFNGVVLGWDGNYSLQENSVRINASTFTYKGNSVLHSGNLGYISSGLSRAVQKDTNGNLFIVAPSLFEQGISNNYPKNLRWSNETEGQLVYDTEIEADNFDTVEIGIPLADGTSKGFLKSTSTVTNVTGYTPCPVVSGTPYYKLDTIELDYTDFLEVGSGNIESHLPITIKVQEGGSLKYLFDYTVDNIPRLLTISEGNFCKYFFWLQQTDDDTPIVAYYHCQFNDLWLVIDSPNMEVRISQGSF